MARSVPCGIFICALVFGIYIYFSETGYENLLRLQKTIAKQEDQNKTMHQHVSKLKSEVLKLKRDDSYVEKYIRENLAYAREDEMVFLFKD